MIPDTALAVNILDGLFSAGIHKPAVKDQIKNLKAEDIESMSQQEVLGLFKSVLAIIFERMEG